MYMVLRCHNKNIFIYRIEYMNSPSIRINNNRSLYVMQDVYKVVKYYSCIYIKVLT